MILGLGGVGYYLAKRLQYEEYAVTAIESEPDQVSYADETLDIQLVRGHAMDLTCWQQVQPERCSCAVAVTNNDAVNMMVAQIAARFGIPNKIARVRSLQYGMTGSLLSSADLRIDLLINPENIVAEEIARLIKLRNGNEVIDIAENQVQLVAARVGDHSPLAHKKLKDITLDYPAFDFRVVAVARGITTIIPSGNREILPHDQLIVMVGTKHLAGVMEMAGLAQTNRQRLMILGGGLVGKRVAELLQKSVKITLVEIDEARAAALSNELSGAEVLHGDGSKAAALTMAGVQEFDTFLAATGDNETNIMSSLLAKNMMLHTAGRAPGDGTEKTIALVNKEDYQVLAATIGLDIALNPKIMAANAILKYIRRSELLSVAHLHGFDADVVELVAGLNSPITKKPLFKLDPHYRGKILIGAVLRNGVWEIAVGDTHIQPEERVIVVCLSLQLKEVRKLFCV